MRSALYRGLLAASMVATLQAATTEAAVIPQGNALTQKSFRQPELNVGEIHQPVGELPALAPGLLQELANMGVQTDSGFFDPRSGRWSSLILSRPLVPGTGAGNGLSWEDLGTAEPADEAALRMAAWRSLQAFLRLHQSELRVDPSELGAPRVGVFEHGDLIQIHSTRQAAGLAVRDSSLTAVINHGNLVLLGLRNWADIGVAPASAIDTETAREIVAAHVSPNLVAGFGSQRQELIPTLRNGAYEFRLAWVVPATVAGDMGSWEALVDATSGDLLAFEDTNQYASRRVVGGVYPVSNDGRPPDGIEQAGWPMPFANVTLGGSPAVTTTGGSLGCSTAAVSTALNGQYVRIADNCGVINESSAGDLDLGTSGGTDCTVPAGHSLGDTHSARSGFYELNRIKEQARAYLPSNAWLQGNLQANMNINLTCNAFWSTGAGTVNFYRDNGSACRNTGEIAAIFDHEWGHGMDANGVAGGVSAPGEGIADIYAFLRLNNSCVGRGFFKNQVCSGYGDGCIGTTATGCTGIRDIDYTLRRCNRPHTVSYITGGFTSAQCGGTGAAGACPAGSGTPCGRATHCEGSIVGETAFDLAKRDLTAAPFNFDSNTAFELSTRLWYLGAQAVTSWYTCAVGGGCGASGGYLQVLAADDDNGNINDGTPHMTAIRAAFERHEIHCATPTVTNSGCAGGPTTAPSVTATAAVDGVNLSWTAVSGASRYYVYRAEGQAACDFGKVKIGDVTGTTFNDTGLLSGRLYSYIVLPVGSNTSCFGRASSCASATPLDASCGVADGTLTGTVTDSVTTNPITGATVQAGAFSDTTDGSGVYSISLPPATYSVTASAVSYISATVGGVVVSEAATTTQDFALDPCSITVSPSTLPAGTAGVAYSQTFTQTGGVLPITWSLTGTLPTGISFSTSTGVLSGTPTQIGSFPISVTATDVNLCQGSVSPTLVINATGPFTPTALVVNASGNSVFEPGETVTVSPSWRNDTGAPQAVTGAASAFTGPGSAGLYTITDAAANYGTVAAGATASCTSSSNCYGFALGTPTTRPIQHWDSTVLETLSGGETKTWTLHVGNSFTDVPTSNGFYRFVETLLHKGVTGGCGTDTYCPATATTREQMAVFVLVSKEGAGYVPAACVAPNVFTDVPETSPYCRYIEELSTRGVVSGCGTNLYCPTDPVTREQMAIFVLRTLDPTLTPPACSAPNLFTDVPETSPFCSWIEELANRGVVTGCGGGAYCPTSSVTREQMAVFLAATFSLALYGL